MTMGLAISGTVHGALILAIVMGLPWTTRETDRIDQAISVTLETLPVAQPTAPTPSETPVATVEPEPEPEVMVEETPPEIAPDIQMTDIAAMATPTFDATSVDRPEAETVPEEAVTDLVEDPSERDSDPDLTALVEVLAQPEVAVEVEVLDEVAEVQASVDAPVVTSTPSPQRPSAPQLSAGLSPMTPPTAPRAPAPPPPSRPDPPPERVEEEEEPSEPQETEVAEADLGALRPRPRPSRFEERVEAMRLLAKVERALEDEIRRLDENVAEPSPEPAPPTALPQGPPMTGAEKDRLRVAVESCWNIPVSIDGDTDATVVLVVDLDPNGRLVGTPRLLEPAFLTDSRMEAAFDAARSSILRCGRDGFELPPEKYAEWRTIEFVFDPSGGNGLSFRW
ncbi:MAG: hypothetical protein AAGA32_05120 [Pseudomonadota bacterium]